MISLIIAVYNTPIKDLQRCFESIQHQTYRDFEVIVVDDGSKDEVASFMDRFSAEDPRFHVHHIENGGVSRARNIGLSYARGEYISFCDADDELTEVFFQHALSYVKHTTWI